jgi:hypothetical protein
MTKTFSDGILPVTFAADQDLSDYQYYAAAPASTVDYVKLASAASDPFPVGVIQVDDADTVGDALSVKTFGFTKAKVSCAVSPIGYGDFLKVSASGDLVVSGSQTVYNARAFGSLASGCGTINVFWYGAAVSGCAVSAS